MQISPSIRPRGFTITELMITVGIMAILFALATPSMVSLFDKHRVVGAAEELYSVVQQARVESLARSRDIFVNITAGGPGVWEYGMSINQGCNPASAVGAADACILEISGDDVLTVFDSTDHDEVTLSIQAGGNELTFSSMRGTVTSAPHTIQFTSGDGKRLQIRVGILGQVRLCTPDGSVSGYQNCV